MADISKTRDLDAMMAERRSRPGLVRDLTDGPSAKAKDGRVFLSPLGWLVAVFCQIGLVVAIVLGALAIPPIWSCRDHDQRGFFAGDTFTACATQGIGARMTQFDQSVRRLILGSGR
ncbi:hypothetical protein G3T14_09040 [Methylobacterium sp. BTF04]|uniref:hypothetical protein n=1 Tax=Methylobacterium sp. BTF04 TaxID=2708300 RepID=UPI0013D4280C|nr:hypothetical protein [Methylobacterium sp. BTF04]NEU12277.1 hypothetical protein [Methylobacterium sp. BTF04]